MKNVHKIILLSIFSLNFVSAGCGACNVSNKKAENPQGNFVMKVNDDGTVDGLVLASCGMCNFGMKSRTCSLAIKINEQAFPVKGTDIEDHGDSHGEDGFCNAIRVADVTGKVKKGVFLASDFKLQKNK